jgi:hypothetical protein
MRITINCFFFLHSVYMVCLQLFLGTICIQDALNATRIYLNPPIPEFYSFKERYDRSVFVCFIFK